MTDPAKGVTTKVTTLDAEEMVGASNLFNMSAAYPGKNGVAVAIRFTTRKGTGMTDKSVGWLSVIDRAGSKSVVAFREQAYTKMGLTVSEEDWWSAAGQNAGDYRLRFDESPGHTSSGVVWTEEFSETKLAAGASAMTTVQKEEWQVVSIDVPVEIDRGSGKGKWSFTCIKVQKKQGGGMSAKINYYSRGVGKVKEEGGQTEELIDYKVNP